jgi:pimeloyl-ACP methyl ester carboxylesterase
MGRLSGLTAPTLFVHGRGDKLIPVDAARKAAALVPGARLAELDTGHWPMREDPAAFADAVLPFLQAP